MNPVPTLVCGVPVDVVAIPHQYNHVPRGPLIPRSPPTHEGGEEQQSDNESARRVGHRPPTHLRVIGGRGQHCDRICRGDNSPQPGGVALWFLWKCIRECNRGSDDEHDLRKIRRYEQKFSTLLDKQDRELRQIAELEERFELQSVCKPTKCGSCKCYTARTTCPRLHATQEENLRRIKSGSDSDDSSIGD